MAQPDSQGRTAQCLQPAPCLLVPCPVHRAPALQQLQRLLPQAGGRLGGLRQRPLGPKAQDQLEELLEGWGWGGG